MQFLFTPQQNFEKMAKWDNWRNFQRKHMSTFFQFRLYEISSSWGTPLAIIILIISCSHIKVGYYYAK